MNLRKSTVFTHLLLLIVLLAAFAACDRVSEIVESNTLEMTESSDHITLGVVLPLTGRFFDPVGKTMQQGFELALNKINKTQPRRQLKFIVEDDQSTVEGTVKAFNKLIHQDGVSVILGPVTSSQTEIAFQIAQENQVVVISTISAARGLSAIGDYVFRIAPTTDALIPRGIEATLKKLGYETAATLYDTSDIFSTDANTAVREILAASGVDVLMTETFQSGDTNFSQQLARIQTLDPDVIFVSSLQREKIGILTQRHQLGISAPFIVHTLTETDVQALDAAAEGVITFVGQSRRIDVPAYQDFVQNYTAKYDMKPDNFAAGAYATLHILAEATSNAQSTDSRFIRDALANIKDLDTIFGKFSFDANGDAIYNTMIMIVKNTELVPFD